MFLNNCWFPPLFGCNISDNSRFRFVSAARDFWTPLKNPVENDVFAPAGDDDSSEDLLDGMCV